MHKNIQKILDETKISGTGENKFLLLFGEPGTGKTSSAQHIAYHTGGNYYHIHQKEFDRYNAGTIASFLEYYIEEISDQTAEGTISVLHLEEFGKYFGNSDNQISNADKNLKILGKIFSKIFLITQKYRLLLVQTLDHKIMKILILQ